MIIKVLITNQGLDRSIEVLEIDFDKERGTRLESPPRRIRPGASQTFYVHQLRDLRIREIHPDREGYLY